MTEAIANKSSLSRLVAAVIVGIMVALVGAITPLTAPAASAAPGLELVTPETWVNTPAQLKIYSASSAVGNELTQVQGVTFNGSFVSFTVSSESNGRKYLSVNGPTLSNARLNEVVVQFGLYPGFDDVKLRHHTIAPPTVTSQNLTWVEGGSRPELILRGSALSGVESVSFGGAGRSYVRSSTSEQIRVTVPDFSPSNTIRIQLGVTRVSGLATSINAYLEFVPRPRVESFTPDGGPYKGGTTVTLKGWNLDQVSKVEVGGRAAEITGQLSSQLEFRTPAGTPDSDAEVVISGPKMNTQTLDKTFRYGPRDPLPDYPWDDATITPATGDVTGGTTVTLENARASWQAMNISEVTVGGTPVQSFRLILGSQNRVMEIVTPPGKAGAAEIRLTGSDAIYVLNQKFRYTSPLEITGPPQGPRTSPHPTITGKGSPGSEVTVKASQKGTAEEVVGTTTVDGNGNWTLTPAEPLTSGSHTLVASDAFAVSSPWEITVSDPIVITYPAKNQVTPIRPTFKGTAHPGASITLTDTASGKSLGTVTVRKNGTWELKVNMRLTPGVHHVTASDEIGLTAQSVFTVKAAPEAVISVRAVTQVVDTLPTRK